MLEATRTVPIVFVIVSIRSAPASSKPVAAGGNATGFTQFEYGLSGKWLELLKEIAPGVTRVAVLRDPTMPPGRPVRRNPGRGALVRGGALPIGVRDAPEIERAVAAFARRANDGLIVATGGLTTLHRNLIVFLAARHSLPAVYPGASLSPPAALTSYGADTLGPISAPPDSRPHPQGREAGRPPGAANQV